MPPITQPKTRKPIATKEIDKRNFRVRLKLVKQGKKIVRESQVRADTQMYL
jgi:hypothetical protein